MRVYRSITIDIFTGAVLAEDSFEYDGIVDLCKKGREQADTASKGANELGQRADNISKADVPIQKGYAAAGDPFAKSLIPAANGALSPYAAAQYEQNKRNIAKTYGDTAAVGLRGIAMRGMGGAPTGLQASIANTAGRNAGEADTNAYENAQQSTLGGGLKGLDYLQGEQQIFDPTRAIAAGTGAYGTAGQVASLRSKMGSTLGDIGQGIGTVAGIAAGV